MMKLEDVLSCGTTHEQNLTIFAFEKVGYKPFKAVFDETATGNTRQWAIKMERGSHTIIVGADGVAEIVE